jgi:hypothetical protein
MIEASTLLSFFGLPPAPPSIRALNQLIDAYICKVPWESVLRIVKRAATPDTARCPRWPDEFWQDTFQFGGGGTCFESNYAFFQLLQSLGYRGYLTVNDMGEQRACHAASVILLDGRRYLVDVSIPLLCALPLDPVRITRRATWLHTYTVQPAGPQRFQILRSRHPKPNIYTLLDTPLTDAAYRQVLTQDYGPQGLFLDRVIIVKIIAGRLWRFSSQDQPYRIESFGRDGRQEIPIPPGQAAHRVAECFGMNAGKIAAAFGALKLSV